MKAFFSKLLERLRRPGTDTPFATFIRTAKAAERKRVYRRVLERATERQNEVLRKEFADKTAA